MFRSYGVDTLHGRQYAQFLTTATNGQVFFFHVAGGLGHKAGNLEVRETEYLCLTEYFFRKVFNLIISSKNVLVINDVLQLAQEPWVNLGQFVDAFDSIAFFQSRSDREDTEVSRVSQLFIQVFELGVFVTYETVHALTNHTETLLDHFFERTTDGHDFTYRLHA